MSLPNLSSVSFILLLSLLFFHFPSFTSSFNISQVLSQYPTYSSFNNYLTQTELAIDINNRQPITILVVDNSGISPLSGKSMDVIKKVLSIHILLDYFDVQKLQDLHNKYVIVTTLYQTTGLAFGQVGLLNITCLTTGAVSFTSPSDESDSISANLVKSVASQPYNLSIVQISTVIMPAALLTTSPLPSSSPKLAPVKSPVRSPKVSPPVGAKSPSPVPMISPIPVMSPMPLISPIPMRSPVPIVSPIPVKSPVPVISPVLVPIISSIPVSSPLLESPLEPEIPLVDSRVTANFGINMALTIMITLLWAIYMLW